MRKDKEKMQSTFPEVIEKTAKKNKKAVNCLFGKRRKGTILILLGVLLIMGSLSLTLYNLWDNNRAGEASDRVLKAMDEEIGAITPTELPAAPYEEPDQTEPFEDPVQYVPVEESSQDTGAMHTISIDTNEYIGTLEIPSLGLRLPVMAAWDYKRLKTSPCLYSGSYLDNNMVICGHNYRKHFSPIKWIDIGADVYFVTVDKVVYHYTVSNRETVQPTSVREMVENMQITDETGTFDRWDLTLFTCNPGGRTRCAVRCIRS